MSENKTSYSIPAYTGMTDQMLMTPVWYGLFKINTDTFKAVVPAQAGIQHYSLTALQRAFNKIQSVLAPEPFAINAVPGNTKHLCCDCFFGIAL